MTTNERPTVSLSNAERRERRWIALLIVFTALTVAGVVASAPTWLLGASVAIAVGCIQGVSAWHGYAAGRRAEAIDAYRRREQGRL